MALGFISVDQLVGQHEVDDRFDVHRGTKVLVVTSAKSSSDTVVGVEHRRDSVESEPIKSIFLHPEETVAQQEAKHFVVTIVEKTRVPKFVSTLGAFVEVKVVGTVEHVETVKDVFACVRVDNVQQYCDAQRVGDVDKLLEVFRVPVSTAGSEEVGDLITERCVVSVFLNGHKLDGVVAELFNTWRTFLVNSLNWPTRASGVAIPTCASYTLILVGLGGLGKRIEYR